jgi:hypothetical protein
MKLEQETGLVALSVISKNGMTYRSSISSTDANAKIGQEMQSGAAHRTLGSEYSDWHRIANCRLRRLPWENQVRVLFSRIFSHAEGLRVLSIIRLLVVVNLCRFW